MEGSASAFIESYLCEGRYIGIEANIIIDHKLLSYSGQTCKGVKVKKERNRI